MNAPTTQQPADATDSTVQAAASMPQYQCHKKVLAAKIGSIKRVKATDQTAGDTWNLVPEDDKLPPINVTGDWMGRHDPQHGGYFVEYEDGYTSYSPAEAFEAGYTLIEPKS
jgi:hypothetical protein